VHSDRLPSGCASAEGGRHVPAGNAEPKLQALLIGTDLVFAARTSLELAAEVEQGDPQKEAH